MKFIKLYLTIIAISLFDSSMEARIAKSLKTVKGSIPRVTKTLRRIDPHVVGNYVDRAHGVFDQIHRGVRWFNRLREVVKHRTLSAGGKKLSHSNILGEIQQCRPDRIKNGRCFSKCGKNDTSYAWCYTSSEHRDSQWDYCSCTIREDVLKFLQIKKEEFLKPPPKSLSTLEISLITATSVLGFLLVIAVIGFGAKLYQGRNQNFAVNNAGPFVHNPLYQPPPADGN